MDPIAAQADRLEAALADLEARKRAAAELAAKSAPHAERLRALEARVAALPQIERREVLDAIGRKQVSAAPKPIEPLRGGGFPAVAAHRLQAPRWPVWSALPEVELWQAVLLSLGIEPEEGLRDEACGSAPARPHIFSRLPKAYFDRRQDAQRALSTKGPIRPQGPLYVGMLQSPKCAVLLVEVGAFLRLAQYQVPDEMGEVVAPAAQQTDQGPRLKREALVRKYERDWPTVDRDLKDGSANGLSDAAKTDEHGMWWELKAVSWARQQGKLKDTPSLNRPATPFDGLGGSR